MIPMRRLVAALAATTTLTLVAGCSTSPDGDGTSANGSQDDGGDRLEPASSEVIADADGTGIETSQRIFEESEAVVVAADTPADQERAANIAVAAGAPMLTVTGPDATAIDEEIDRLGADTVVTVGDTGTVAEGSETIDGTAPAGEDATAEETTGEAPADEAAPEAPVDGAAPAVDVAAIAALDAESAEGLDELDHAEHPLAMPTMFVTDQTSPASVATARAAGADVQHLAVADPRLTTESMQAVTDGEVLALGEAFGDQERFDKVIDLADNGELPGGGGLLFPGRRMIAYYGHPSGGALGVMGEQPPAEAVERVKAHIENYQPLEEQPVIPAFEIIVTVASEFPGEDGKFTNIGDPAEFVPYIDAITEAGGYAFLDLQPGQASFLEQAQVYEELLKRPNVGLALDPEWNLQPGEQPLQRVGHAEAAEINEVADWLAALVRDNDLPQKGLIVHQFQMQMLRDREQINTSHPELSFILHADGHGVPGQKLETWNAVREGLSPDWHMAWKNFIDEDNPTFTPEQTYDVEPRPWFVSYQ